MSAAGRGRARLLHPAGSRADERGAGGPDRPAPEGHRRPGPPPAPVDGAVPRGWRGLRVRPDPGLRPVPADHQPPPEGAARVRAAAPGEARCVGVLPGPPRGDGGHGHPVRHGGGRGPRVSDTVHEAPQGPEDAAVLHRLSTLDRFLPVWIGLAMVLGLLLGHLVPGLDDALSKVEIGSVSLPIAIGLLVMMYPVLAKVRYDQIGHVTADHT